MTPKNVDYVILATCVLHNFIKQYDGFITLTDEKNINNYNASQGVLQQLSWWWNNY